jgi:hypothetical protein
MPHPPKPFFYGMNATWSRPIDPRDGVASSNAQRSGMVAPRQQLHGIGTTGNGQ